MSVQRGALVLFILVLAPYLLLAFFVHPAADDYTYVVKAAEHGYWGGQYRFYMDWTGRYMATAGISLNLYTLESLWFFRLFPLLLFVLLCYAGKTLLRCTAGDLFAPAERWLLSAGFLALFVSNIPTPAEGLYWWPGVVTYMLPVVVAVFSACLLVPHFRQPKPLAVGDMLALLLAAFFIIGCNETILLMWLYVCGCLLAWDYWRVRRVYPGQLVLALASTLFALSVILAPGNAIRTAEFPDSHRPFYALWQSLVEVVSHLGQFMSLALLAATVLFAWLIVQRPTTAIPNRSSLRWTLLFAFGLLYAGFFPSLWAMGDDPPKRVDNMLYYLFLWFWFTLAYQWVALRRERVIGWFEARAWLGPGALVAVLAVGFVLGRNNYTAWYDLLFNAAPHSAAHDARYPIYEQARGQDLVLEPIVPHAETIMVSDISPDPEYWLNEALSDYYQLKSVRLQE